MPFTVPFSGAAGSGNSLSGWGGVFGVGGVGGSDTVRPVLLRASLARLKSPLVTEVRLVQFSPYSEILAE